MDEDETMRLFDGCTPSGPVAVDLPLAWAWAAEQVQVRFHQQSVLGWHARVLDGDELVLDLVWSDHVDRMLLADDGQLPTTAPEVEWEDIDQCYRAVVRRHGDHLFVAEVDGDDLERHAGAPPRLLRPGHVCVGDTEVLWHRVPVAAWDAAWVEGRRFFAPGRHLTVARAPDPG